MQGETSVQFHCRKDMKNGQWWNWSHHCPPCGSSALPAERRQINRCDRLQMGLDKLAFRLQERRQREPFSERIDIFINGKTWLIGGNFEEYPSRLAEVDGAEVETIDDRSHAWMNSGDALPPLAMLFIIWGAECDVVNASNPDEAMERSLGIDLHMHLGARSSGADLEDSDRRLLGGGIRAGAPETKHSGQKTLRGFERTQREPHGIEATNRHLGRNGTLTPGRAYQLSAIVDQFETLPFGVAKWQHQLITVPARLNTIMRNLEILKTSDPPFERVATGNAKR